MYAHLDSRNRLAAGQDTDLSEGIDGHDGGGLGHAVTGRVLDTRVAHEDFDVPVQRRAAEHEKPQVAAERADELASGHGVQADPEERDLHQTAGDRIAVEFRQDPFPVDLVHHQRNGQDTRGFRRFHRLQQLLRRGQALHVLDEDAHGQGTEHSSGGLEGVREREDGQEPVLRGQRKFLERLNDVENDVFVGEHHALGVTRGAGRVDDDRQIRGLRGFPFGFGPGGPVRAVGLPGRGEVLQFPHETEISRGLQPGREFRGCECGHGAGIDDDVPDVFLREAGQDGHGHRAGKGHGQIGDHPVRAVVAQNHDPVAGRDAVPRQIRGAFVHRPLQAGVGHRRFPGVSDRRKGGVPVEGLRQQGLECEFFKLNHVHSAVGMIGDSRRAGRETQDRLSGRQPAQFSSSVYVVSCISFRTVE